jgi:predicted Zn finger-like uncharacterized protein
MILTCPACDTKYVVKDDAIPPGGRQVRCASCKHSWHQDQEMVAAEPASAADIDFGGPPPADPGHFEQPMADLPDQARAEDMIAGEPVPEPDDGGQSAWGPVSDEPPVSEPAADEVAMEEAPAIADEWRAPPVEDTAPPAEDEFVGYAPIEDDEDAPRRRWPMLLAIVILIAAAAAAFWFFAPPEWKARAGLANAGATPLQLMITTRDRQRLESGNELVVISGRIINSTDEEQIVPPIQAELRDSESKAVVHRWTITPPTRVLGPGKSASFNSAEVDEPRTGAQLLSIRLGS